MQFPQEDKTLYRSKMNKDLPEIPAGVMLRNATADDYQPIIEFSKDICPGRDYLKAMYHKYLVHPLRYLFVAELNHRVVSSLTPTFLTAECF